MNSTPAGKVKPEPSQGHQQTSALHSGGDSVHLLDTPNLESLQTNGSSENFARYVFILMSLIQYSRDFLLSKKCQPVDNLDVLASISPLLDILTKGGSKTVQMTLTKKSTKKKSPQVSSKKSGLNSLKSAVDMYMNSNDTFYDACESLTTSSSSGSTYSGSQDLGAASSSLVPPCSAETVPSSAIPRIQYSRNFLLARRCVPNSGEVLAQINISNFISSPFTQGGLKKILHVKKQFSTKTSQASVLDASSTNQTEKLVSTKTELQGSVLAASSTNQTYKLVSTKTELQGSVLAASSTNQTADKSTNESAGLLTSVSHVSSNSDWKQHCVNPQPTGNYQYPPTQYSSYNPNQPYNSYQAYQPYRTEGYYPSQPYSTNQPYPSQPNNPSQSHYPSQPYSTNQPYPSHPNNPSQSYNPSQSHYPSQYYNQSLSSNYYPPYAPTMNSTPAGKVKPEPSQGHQQTSALHSGGDSVHLLDTPNLESTESLQTNGSSENFASLNLGKENIRPPCSIAESEQLKRLEKQFEIRLKNQQKMITKKHEKLLRDQEAQLKANYYKDLQVRLPRDITKGY
ncbi:uncharacterized protein LOC113468367 [Diaphorina citri]|uniref:Uncharacterized protein LOC113468367 n=1 Tax=Diaphorina citri TaxID=121845 RepID=A0A3Q0IXQ6_DIACI|nr:uncharacterized protein LOC113468367 [Diaphorina citri]